MRRTLMVLGLAAVVATPSLASARSYCEQRAHDRKVTGTVLGGVGGALIGGAIGHSGTGALLGGLGGAVIGNQVSRTSCDGHYARYHSRAHVVPRRRPHDYDNAAYTAPSGCRYETRPYYDERGQMVYQPTQVCR
jgi:uncharacterized protein YcfJ